MFDRQDIGMEGLSAKGLERRLGFQRQKRALGAKTRSIDLVAQQGMPDRGQMQPNLVGTAGFEAAEEETGHRRSRTRLAARVRSMSVRHAVAFEHFPVRDRLAPA